MSYVRRLRQRVTFWRQDLAAVRRSALPAARGVCAGGSLYVAGPQTSFAVEALGRAGGLMLMQGWSAGTRLTADDTVLAAATDQTPPDSALADLLEKARSAGAHVILFSAVDRERLSGFGRTLTLLPSSPPAAEAGTPRLSIESASNVVGLWTWTAEFVAACVEQGKMPCLYESYWLPGGRERGEALQGLRFHRTTSVTRISVNHLGERYLEAAAYALRKVTETDSEAIRRGGEALAKQGEAGRTARVYADGHMFPNEIRVSQNPAWLQPAAAEEHPGAGEAIVMLGYQSYPWKQMASLGIEGRLCILTTSLNAPAEFTQETQHIYIRPYWAITDAAISLDGYDIPILPLSGLMQTAVYWSLVEASQEAADRRR